MDLTNHLTPLLTFHQWVEKRVLEHDFAAYGQFYPDGKQWSLEGDGVSYVKEYLTPTRSKVELRNFMDRLNEVEEILDRTSTTAQERSNRRRRMLYGHRPEMSVELTSMMQKFGAPNRGGNQLFIHRKNPKMMAGIPEGDIDALIETMEKIQRIIWIATTLNDFSQERQQEFYSALEREREVFFKIEPFFTENSKKPWEKDGAIPDFNAPDVDKP